MRYKYYIGTTAINSYIKGMALSTLALSVFLTVKPALATDTTEVVLPGELAQSFADVMTDPTKWFFFNDENNTIDNTLGSYVVGPDTAPYGSDSIQISVTGTQRRNLATYQFSGTKLADVTELKFSTYNPSAGNVGSTSRSAYLNFNVDFNGSDTWQKRLVFVPSANGVVTQDSWKEWDAINGGNALWTWSGFAANGNKWPDNNTTPNRTWSDLTTSFPDISVRTTDSWLGLRVGEPYADGYTENLDGFKFGVNGDTKIFDFDSVELIGPPTDKSSCKKGGWMQFNNPVFKNQGQCDSFLNHNDGKGNDDVKAKSNK